MKGFLFRNRGAFYGFAMLAWFILALWFGPIWGHEEILLFGIVPFALLLRWIEEKIQQRPVSS